MRVLGLDPGLRRTGWGVIRVEGSRLAHIAEGVVRPDAALPLALRLVAIHDALAALIALHRPDEAAVEETFVNRNAASSLKLGLARGVALLVPGLARLPVSEYPARLVKQSVVGTGGASKDQVAQMVRRLLPTAGAVSADAADALAVAICHAHRAASLRRWRSAAAGRVAAGRPVP